jgi:hypothetical protein
MLKIIGGLLAVGALAVAPTAATAKVSGGGGGGGGGGCSDNWSPQSNWGNGWYGNDGNGGNSWRGWGDGNGDFGGHSSDQGCNGSSSTARAARVARVMVAVQRLSGSKCQHLSRSGSLSKPTGCSPHWFKATGLANWHHHIAKRLPQGRYRLYHRAFDAAGNRGKLHVRHVSALTA